MQKFLSIIAIIFMIYGCSSDYSGAYTTNCQVDKNAARLRLREIAREVSSKIGARAKSTSDRPLSLVIDIPLVPGEAPYRLNSSGQIFFGELDSGIAVDILRPGKGADSVTRNIRSAVEDALSDNDCKPWTFDQQTQKFHLG